MRKYNVNIDSEVIEIYANNIDEALEIAQELLEEYEDAISAEVTEVCERYSNLNIESEFDYGVGFYFEKLM